MPEKVSYNPDETKESGHKFDKYKRTDLKMPPPEIYSQNLREMGYEKTAQIYDKSVELCQIIKENDGQALAVGGFVRDWVMGKASKDIDLEVYGLEPTKLKEVTSEIGKVAKVGQSFGLLLVNCGEGINIDVALPRTESKVGIGHKEFDVEPDPNLDMKDAAKRRDFTMNSILADPLTGDVYDPFHGVEDIKEGNLRVTNEETFKEDPLRVLRAMQFVGRFALGMDDESRRIVKETVPLIKEEKIPANRIREEWYKLFDKSELPSHGLLFGMELGILSELNPEISDLRGIPQSPEYHPEGDALIHTMQVIDMMKMITSRERELPDKDKKVLWISALCHDLGKVEATQTHDDGKITSHGHEKAGLEPTKTFLDSINADNYTRNKVMKLVPNHMRPIIDYNRVKVEGGKVSDEAIRRLAKKLAPATIYELALLAEADVLGRRGDEEDPLDGELFRDGEFLPRKWLLDRARNLGVEKSKPDNIIQGRTFIARGFKGGKNMGVMIDLANKLRYEKNIDREEILTMISDLAPEDPSGESAIAKMKEALA